MKYFKNLIKWCNENQGLLTLIAVIITILGLIPFNKINFIFTNSLIDKIIVVIIYNVKIPVYLLVTIIIIGWIYINNIKQKYSGEKITMNILVDEWKIEWTINGKVVSNICEIKYDGKFFVDGKHTYNIKNFRYDYKTDKITFIKSPVDKSDKRKMKSILIRKNNDLIIGLEDNYDIKYIRITYSYMMNAML